jgi:hypothetical protein
MVRAHTTRARRSCNVSMNLRARASRLTILPVRTRCRCRLSRLSRSSTPHSIDRRRRDEPPLQPLRSHHSPLQRSRRNETTTDQTLPESSIRSAVLLDTTIVPPTPLSTPSTVRDLNEATHVKSEFELCGRVRDRSGSTDSNVHAYARGQIDERAHDPRYRKSNFLLGALKNSCLSHAQS